MTFQSASNAHAKSNRDIYLQDTLRLNHDPFANPVSEWEVQINPEDPPFFVYYTNPPYESEDGENNTLLDRLQQPGAAIIYGSAGSGKTALCYRLEAACREIADQTLVINHVLGKGNDQIDIDALWYVVSETLATDLFIQVLERFDTLSPFTIKDLTPLLAQYWLQTIPHFTRKVQRHLAQSQSTAVTGMSAQWWPVWQRAAVRYTPLTPARIHFLKRLLDQEPNPNNGLPNEAALQDGVSLAQQIGFQQIFFLVDVVDVQRREISSLTKHIAALWRVLLPLRFDIPLYPKFFLPASLQPFVADLIKQTPLISPGFSAIIKWNNSQALVQLIENRFRSAGSWIKGFDVLASQEIAEGLNEAIFHAADQSPRRLLQLLSLLIDAHAGRDPADPQITAVDWQRLCDMWSYGNPRPTPLKAPSITAKGT